MKKLLILLLSSNLFSQTMANEWFQGGSLHTATMAEWELALESNKLATCADWVSKLYLDKSFTKNTLDAITDAGRMGIKEMADLCVTMVNKEAIPEISHQEALKVYIISMIKIGLIDFDQLQ